MNTKEQNWQQMQAEFLRACGNFTTNPRDLTIAIRKDRREEVVRRLLCDHNLILEEVSTELLPHLRNVFTRNEMIQHTAPTQVMSVEDLETIADDIADSIYVLCQLANTMGIQIAPFYTEVHRANMTKVGADGKVVRREDGKILKPEGWTAPDLTRVLARQLDAAAGPNGRQWQVTVTEGLLQLQNMCKMDTEMQMYMKNNDKETVAILMQKAAYILTDIAEKLRKKEA